MAWPDGPLPVTRHEVHFGDRVVRCFVDRPPSVFAMLEGALTRNSDGLALIDGDLRLTYRELAARVERLAAGLAAHGVEPGDRVALLLGNRVEFPIALLAAARLGAIVVPLGVREPPAGLHDLLEHSGAKALIYHRDLADRLPPDEALPGLRVRASVEVLERDAESAPAPHRPGEEEVAVILYTSGTTGWPKGAMLTHVNLAHSVIHYAHCMGLGAGERSLLAVPATHVTGVVAILLAMTHVAGTTVIMREFKARRFLELAARERITHTLMVPAMYNLCLLDPEVAAFDLTAWRVGAYGGAPMPEATIARLAALAPGLVLMNVYGATETTSPTTLMPQGHTAGRTDSVGRVVPCGEVRIMDERGCEVASGAAGEIWIKGPMVVPGYWANDTATRAAFTGGYWRSGDVGSLDADGYLRVFDRIKDMINRGGYKVFSAEVENVLGHHPTIVEAAVVAEPDPVLGEKVHAFVTVWDDLSADQVRAHCATHLADYKVPDVVTLGTEPLPRNPAGKLQKHALRRRLAEAGR